MKPLVIGIGNVLRGDDGVGVRLVEELAEAWGTWSAPAAELKTVHQLTPELVLDLARTRRVLFVDAWRVEPGVSAAAEPWMEWLTPPGQAISFPNGESDGVSPFSGHALEPGALVAMAQLLDGWHGEAALLRVPARAFGHGAEFSPPLRRVLPLARRRLEAWLERGCSQPFNLRRHPSDLG